MKCKHGSLGTELILRHRGQSTKERGIDVEETDMLPEIKDTIDAVLNNHVFELRSLRCVAVYNML